MIDARISVNDTRLRVSLNDLPRRLQNRLERAIRGLTKELLHKVEAREPVRTGRLRRLTRAYVDRNKEKNFIRGRVRVLRTRDHNTAAAAGALEYGSTGKAYMVGSHTRNGNSVRGYMRTGGITAQRFLRGPAAIMIPKARAELRRVLSDASRDILKD
jgi:hypothetical protein